MSNYVASKSIFTVHLERVVHDVVRAAVTVEAESPTDAQAIAQAWLDTGRYDDLWFEFHRPAEDPEPVTIAAVEPLS
jgi:hypothetical protein